MTKVAWIIRGGPKSHHYPAGTRDERCEVDLDSAEFEWYRGQAQRLTVLAPGPALDVVLNETCLIMDAKAVMGAVFIPADEAPLPASAGRARARTTDPDTSHAAAASLTPETLRETQIAVRSCLMAFGDMHHERLVETYQGVYAERGWPQQSESGLRTRTKELTESGLVRNTGRTITLPSGRQSIVWAANMGVRPGL